MKASEFKKLIREEVRRALKETKATGIGKRKLNELEVNPDPNKEVSGFGNFNFDKFAKTCPVVLSSEYEGEWMDENPDWDQDFVPLQNALYAKFTDGKDFALMIGMGDDIFNALAIKNMNILQDPTIKKLIKKIMGYGGLEVEKGKVAESRKRLKEAGGKVTKAELKTMKGTVGWIANEDTAYDIPDSWPSYIVSDIQVVSFDEGAKEVLEYAKDYGAGSEQIKEMAAKLKELKTMGNKFVLYGFEADLNLGVL